MSERTNCNNLTFKERLNDMFRKLFCKHDYEVIGFGKMDYRIIQLRRCKKCGKRITVVM